MRALCVYICVRRSDVSILGLVAMLSQLPHINTADDRNEHQTPIRRPFAKAALVREGSPAAVNLVLHRPVVSQLTHGCDSFDGSPQISCMRTSCCRSQLPLIHSAIVYFHLFLIAQHFQENSCRLNWCRPTAAGCVDTVARSAYVIHHITAITSYSSMI